MEGRAAVLGVLLAVVFLEHGRKHLHGGAGGGEILQKFGPLVFHILHPRGAAGGHQRQVLAGFEPAQELGGFLAHGEVRAEDGVVHLVRAHDLERGDKRATDARMADVSDDADAKALDAAETLANGVQVEQRLRRMLMLAVTCADDGDAGNIGDLARRSRVLVAHDDGIDLVRAECLHGVAQALALPRGGRGPAEVERIA